MNTDFAKLLQGYSEFRKKYVEGQASVMQQLASFGQQPEIMIIACSDSRVDPALLFQCDPGDFFVVRNVANIIPPYEHDLGHHGVSAALEFGINILQVKHLIILGHSQCGGIQARIQEKDQENDFLHNWLSLIPLHTFDSKDVDRCARQALEYSYQNAMQFPCIQKRVQNKNLILHSWFFDITSGQIFDNNKPLA